MYIFMNDSGATCVSDGVDSLSPGCLKLASQLVKAVKKGGGIFTSLYTSE